MVQLGEVVRTALRMLESEEKSAKMILGETPFNLRGKKWF